MYAYKARLVEVIDGDTLLVDLDLGFHIWTRQILRLTGLDLGEHTTTEENRREKEAQAFLERKLGDCDFVVETFSLDHCGDYLCDIVLDGRTLNDIVGDLGLSRGSPLPGNQLH